MSLTVEDGTIVPDADSYVSVVDFRAYATKRGWTLPVDEPACEALLTKALDFLEGLKYIGVKVDPALQSLQWPRKDACVDGVELEEDVIPKNIVAAQCVLGFISQTIDLQPSQSATAKGPIQTESVYGAVSRTYFQKAGPQLVPYLTSVNSLLDDYVISGLSGVGGINTVAIRR